MEALKLKGKRFGKLLVLDRIQESTKKQESQWECLCDCGAKISATGWRIKMGNITSCGCKKRTDLTGKRFGLWTALKYFGKQKWECSCDCGTKKLVSSTSLILGRSKSCGCVKKRNIKRG